MVKHEGWTSAAAQLAREPEQLGELRGRVEWLTSAAAKQERAAAVRAAGVLPGSLERIGAAEGRADRAYRAGVEGQRAADAVGIPRPSVGATQQDKHIATELSAFQEAEARLLGNEGVRQMLRAGGQPMTVQLASITSKQRPALDRVAALITTLRQGERSHAAVAQRQAKCERQGLRRGIGH